ncbi:hypothetical protein [Aureivirga sp. CE67]|uniref:hypothetical protein n=1 Tax=Aureivirga sp. CE67 TaxID=1788983 RepID=UPI0018CAA924|nr:hypothetical protein [Aureivirga sp. CE67]
MMKIIDIKQIKILTLFITFILLLGCNHEYKITKNQDDDEKLNGSHIINNEELKILYDLEEEKNNTNSKFISYQSFQRKKYIIELETNLKNYSKKLILYDLNKNILDSIDLEKSYQIIYNNEILFQNRKRDEKQLTYNIENSKITTANKELS